MHIVIHNKFSRIGHMALEISGLLKAGLLCWLLLASSVLCLAQQDSTALQRLVGSIGQDTSGRRRESAPEQNTERLMAYEGKIIRSISIRRLGFEMSIADTANVILYKGAQVLNSLHFKSREETIRRNLYIYEGTPFNPYLAADNERFLRTVGFIQDSRIVVRRIVGDSIDVEVVTKDLFSYAPRIGGIGPLRQRMGIADINLAGTGQRVALEGLHDTRRRAAIGYAAEYMYTNLAGSFWNVGVSFGNIFRNIYDRREDEESFFITLERPLVSQYKRFAGGFTLGKGRSLNSYPNYYGGDYYRYHYGLLDGWIGYNIGAKKYKNDKLLHVKKFVSLRYYAYHPYETPYQVADSVFDQRFNSKQAVLVGLTLFKQYFYKTKYIYGFGITEDVPAGFNVAFTAGWYRQLNLSRPYAGVNAYRYRISLPGDISGTFLRTGAFYHNGAIQDVSVLAGASFFSRILTVNNLKMRQYFRFSYSGIYNRVALDPLRINNSFGIRHFTSDLAAGWHRVALRSETFAFLERKILGFRFSPLFTADIGFLMGDKNLGANYGLFAGIGAGIRTRNDNLGLGTLEVRAAILPRKLPGDGMFKLSAAANLKFRYNNSYVSKPDIVELNGDINGDIY
jgi:hypothetical protein